MDIEQIMAAIRSLAQSQGYYGRLYSNMQAMQENFPERWEEIKEELEAQNFKDSLDMVMYFET